jgi:hypothetical protein
MMKSVASPPSSTMMLGPFPSGKLKDFNMYCQYSFNVSPLIAKTLAVLALAIAAAAWS